MGLGVRCSSAKRCIIPCFFRSPSILGGVSLGVAPGVPWAEHVGDWKTDDVTHREAAYVCTIGEYGIGPVMDYSKTHDEEPSMVGIHFGVHR